jgi:hypothetical protein
VRNRSGHHIEENDASDAAYKENLNIGHANLLNSRLFGDLVPSVMKVKGRNDDHAISHTEVVKLFDS